jgi:hypothetical protein
MHFSGGQAVTLTMQGASHVEGRTVRIDGTRATLVANEARREIAVIDHASREPRSIEVPAVEGGHGGGDWGLIDAFVAALRGQRGDVLTSARESVESHLMAFAAEQARISSSTVSMADYRADAGRRLRAAVRT